MSLTSPDIVLLGYQGTYINTQFIMEKFRFFAEYVVGLLFMHKIF